MYSTHGRNSETDGRTRRGARGGDSITISIRAGHSAFGPGGSCPRGRILPPTEVLGLRGGDPVLSGHGCRDPGTGPVGSRQRTQSAIPFHTRHSISQVASVSNLSNQPTPREPSERNRVRSRRGTRQSNTHPIKHHISRQGHLTPRYARAHTAARRPNGAVRLWPVYMPLCALIIWMALTPMRSVSSHAS